MANRINFNIGFKSDTSQVQSDLNKLKMQLSAITTDPINLSDLDFQPAIKAAQTLQKALNDAFDIDTQNIDLAKFSDSLEASGQNLTTIANTLKGAGVEGVQTFQNLAKVVTNAQTPMKKTNKLLDDMWTTMKNTMKWNISASILNSFQGALQRSYYYAKDLDESLTNISVITGKSREEMASFAESANDAARALNASTTSYTDAALIYYQQGLSEEDVQARTDVTIKAANVARESGEQMSEYLTAIWNGYKVEAAEAELYVDKVSAVAAATAADLAELSEGFSKVASAANAMGVDVDRLNSYLATVISTTREAPETVGTAFRTIFARLNSISLGEEEDGWGLSQVGKTLEKIGISIKDQEGNLRNTGEVMDEIGEKWATLSHETQQAVAVAMAGRQQYSRLISLFDNWDQYQSTLLVSQQAEGTLQEQANIYAEGWEAAQQRVDTALEGIYTKFLDSDFFIDFLGGLEDAIEDIDTFIDRMGGAGNVLLSLGGIATQVFNKQIANGFNNLFHNLNYFTGRSSKQASNVYSSMARSIDEFILSSKFLTEQQKAELNASRKILELRSELTETSRNLTEEQQRAAESQIDLIAGLEQQRVKIQENISALEAETKALRERQSVNLEVLDVKAPSYTEEEQREITRLENRRDNINNRVYQGNRKSRNSQKLADVHELKQIEAQLASIRKTAEERNEDEIALIKVYSKQKSEVSSLEGLMSQLPNKGKMTKEEMQDLAKIYKIQDQDLLKIIGTLDEEGKNYDEIIKLLDQYLKKAKEKLNLNEQDVDALASQNKLYADLKKEADELAEKESKRAEAQIKLRGLGEASNNAFASFRQTLKEVSVDAGKVAASSVAYTTELVQTATQVKNIIDTFKDSDVDGLEKINTLLTSLMFTVPQVYSASKRFSEDLSGLGKKLSSAAGATTAFGAATKGLGAALSAAAPYIALIGIALSVVTALISNHVQKQKELREERTKETAELIENIKTRQQEQQAIQGTVSEYQNLLSIYRETGEIEGGLIRNTQDLIDAYGAEGTAIAQLTGDYEGLAKAINNSRNEQNKEKVQESQNAVDTAAKTFAENNAKNNFIDFGMAGHRGFTGTADVALLKDILDDFDTFGGVSEIDLNGKEIFQAIELAQEDIDQIPEILYQLEQNLEKFNTSNQEIIKAIIEEAGEDYQNYKLAREVLEQIQVQSSLDEIFDLSLDYSSMTEESFHQLKVSALDALTSLGIPTKVAQKALEEYLKAQNNVIQSLNLENNAIQEKINLLKQQGIEINRDQLTKYYNSLDENQQNLFLSFTPQYAGGDWSNFIAEFELSLGSAIDDAVAANRETLQNALNQLYSEGVIDEETMIALTEAFPELASLGGQALYQQIETIQGYLAQSSADFVASQEAEVLALEEQLIYLKERYKYFFDESSQLSVLMEELAETENELDNAIKSNNGFDIVQAQNEIARLKELIKNEYGIELDIEGFNFEKTKLDSEIKEVENAIQNALSDDFDIGIDVTLQDTDNLISEMEALSEAASKIGEGYRIAADDLDYFASRFPQMLEGAQAYTDGTIQLNQAIVDSAFATADKDITADRETLKAKLLNQKAMLEFKKQTLQSQLALAQSLANGEITYDQYSKQVQQLAEEQMTAYVAQKYGEQAGEAFKSTSQQSGFIIAVTQLAQEKSDVIAQSFVDAYGDAGDTASNSAAIQVKALNAIEQAAANASQALYAMSINQPYTYKGVTYDSTTVNRVKTAVTADVQSAEDALAEIQNTIYDLSQYQVSVPEGQEDAQKGLQKQIDDYQNEIDKLAKEFGAEKVEELNAQIAATDKELASVNATILKLDSNTVQLTNNIKQVGKAAANGASATKEAIELLDEEIDRYHEINNLIDENNRLLEKTRKNKDRLYGSNYISALEDEIDLLERDKELTEKKLAISEEQLEVARQGANAAGAEIDANGMISNYYEYLANRQNALNAQIQAGQLTEEEVEAEKEAIELTKKLFDQYEEEFQTYIEQLDRLDEIAQEMADAALEKVTKQVEFDLTITDDSLKVLDYFIQKNEDFFEMAERFDLVEEKYTTIPNQLETYYQGILDLQEQLNDPDANHAEINAKIREYRDGMISSLEAMQELEKEMETAYADALEQGADELSKYTNQLDHVTDSLNHFINLLGLMGKEDHYDTIGRIYEAQIENGRNQLEVQKQMLEGYKQQQELLRQTGMEGTDDWFALVDAIAEAENELYDTTEATLEAIGELYENTIEGILSQLEESLSGSSFDSVSDAYDRYTDEQERFLTKTQQLYELSKLQSDIQQEMDATDSPARKQKLKDLNDYVQGLQEQNKLSQYELEYAQAKYDLALKEMALEEAKNAKTDLRLVRDSQGNWTYQYTADQDAIGDSQQAYQESLNNMYELSLKRVSELEKEVIEINEEMKEALENIERDNYETAEDYQAALLEVREFYQQKLYDVYDQYNIARQNLEKDTYDLTISLTNDAILAAERQKQGYNKNIEDMINKLAGEGSDSFKNATEIAIDAMTKAWQDWRDSVDEVSELVQLTEDDIIDKTEELEDTSEDLADTITGDVVPAIFSEIDAVRQQVLAFNQAKAALQDLIAKYEEFIRTLQIAEGAQKAVNSKDYSSGSTGDIASNPTGGSSGGSGNTDSNPSNKTDVITGYKVKATTSTGAGLFYETVSATGFNVGPYIGRAAKQAYLDEQAIITVTEKHSITNDKTSTYKVQGTKKRPIYAGGNGSSITKSPGQALFDTGGYTGDWNSDEGRTAILHEKELVLNKADTENMLQTVGIVRTLKPVLSTIEHNLDLNAQNAMVNRILPSYNISNNYGTDLNQNVRIEASFPNVTNSGEIEQALSNLVNEAAQFAKSR